MTTEIILVFAILLTSVILFITERIQMEVVALLVLVVLAVTGLVTPAEAVSGFSNPAVITVLAMFIIGGALARTGVANYIGRQVLRLAGEGEARLILVIMITATVLSSVMNNVGVAAMMLPVVMDLARRTGNAPARLLMPLAFGSLLGGTLTLIGTPTNLLAADVLRSAGLTPFGFFAFLPVGLAITIAGIIYILLVGRHLLPSGVVERAAAPGRDIDYDDLYELQQRLYSLQLPYDSTLAGKDLIQSRLGTALHLNVIAIQRSNETMLAPRPDTLLRGGDKLIVQGRLDLLEEIRNLQIQSILNGSQDPLSLISEELAMMEGVVAPHSPLVGHSLLEAELRRRYGVTVLAVKNPLVLRRTNFLNVPLQAGDRLLILGKREQLDELADKQYFDSMHDIDRDAVSRIYRLHERSLALQLPPDTVLVGRSLAESRLGDALGLSVLAIVRADKPTIMPEADETLQAGDTLLVQGRVEDLETLRGLQELIVEAKPVAGMAGLESAEVGLAEVVFSPHSRLVGQTLRQMHFREKYELSVVAIWREGRAYRSEFRDMPLRLGDALLVYGTREKVQLLGTEPDFLVLTEAAQEPLRLQKAPLAALVLLAVLVPVLLGWLPISIAGLAGATLMILFGALTVEEAYRYIDLKSIFLIAGMLPLGIAMEQTGAAAYVSGLLISTLDNFGPYAILAGLFLLTVLATQTMPSAAVLVLMAPIALNAAADLGLSPYALLMTVTVAVAACFLGPVAHPANVLVMGPGGYRFKDYLRVGLPLVLLILVVVLLVLPIFWPLG